MTTLAPCKQPRDRATVVVRRGARLASLVAGAFAMSLLGGADGCTITIEPIVECTDLDDVCPNLACEVYQEDDDGCAICECEEPAPTGCFLDEDCAPGEYCDYNHPAADEPAGDDGDGNTDEAGLMAPEGQCRPLPCPAAAPAPPLCTDDELLVCEASDDGCSSSCYCMPLEPSEECLEDSDCRDAQRCELNETCPACVDEDPGCDAACTLEGRCVSDEPPPGCGEALCAPGHDCVETDDGPQCLPVAGQCDDGSEPLCDMVPPTCEDGLILAHQNHCYACVDPATCEPSEPTLSCANVDCAPGYECVETDGGPQCIPPDGYCGDGSEVMCETLVEPSCPDGQVVVVRDGCYTCADAAVCGLTCANVDCAEGYECHDRSDGPTCVQTSEGCYSDQDCGEGAVCNASDVCLPPPGCNDAGVACPDVCYGECVVVEETAGGGN